MRYESSKKPVWGKRIAVGAVTAALTLSTWPVASIEALAEDANGTSSDDAASEDSGNTVSTSETAKKEVVYSKTDASGKTSGIFVVNTFNTKDAITLSDPGTYKDVTNLSDERGPHERRRQDHAHDLGR
jgi:hypothetical protein